MEKDGLYITVKLIHQKYILIGINGFIIKQTLIQQKLKQTNMHGKNPTWKIKLEPKMHIVQTK